MGALVPTTTSSSSPAMQPEATNANFCLLPEAIDLAVTVAVTVSPFETEMRTRSALLTLSLLLRALPGVLG